ncbi:hypothetical protein CAPTEDRAFT_192581 [Capitella teleta]|uniref:Uncharacterized protein n=1 Tax=Capitella teleta TaxID=283909 RepID=R7V1N9_CAPTE|nr:hypothetical protein CAPTEDRAFT_192581 [Capitella teleta]|eukprot:ELU12758.1 hypothetical protein CAPTEDRAFT_192581 [Capitella teleta]
MDEKLATEYDAIILGTVRGFFLTHYVLFTRIMASKRKQSLESWIVKKQSSNNGYAEEGCPSDFRIQPGVVEGVLLVKEVDGGAMLTPIFGMHYFLTLASRHGVFGTECYQLVL